MADEYIRKADAKDALQEKVFHNLTDEFYGAMQVLDELPPADVVPVVRCKDCENWDIEWKPIIAEGHYCVIIDKVMKPNDFCSYGKLK